AGRYCCPWLGLQSTRVKASESFGPSLLVFKLSSSSLTFGIRWSYLAPSTTSVRFAYPLGLLDLQHSLPCCRRRCRGLERTTDEWPDRPCIQLSLGTVALAYLTPGLVSRPGPFRRPVLNPSAAAGTIRRRADTCGRIS